MGVTVAPLIQSTVIEKSYIPINNGNIIYVGGSGPGNYSKIQDAIDDANEGDTVFVYDESSPYYENIDIHKGITVIGENKETTIIDGNLEDENVVYLKGPGAIITRFTIQNGDFLKAGVLIDGVDNTVIDNIIKDNYYGIRIWGKNLKISKNMIKNNIAHGIYAEDDEYSSNITIDNNTFEEQDGIYIEDNEYSNTLIIENNTANGKPIRCFIDKEDVIVPSFTSQVILINCQRCTITNMNFSDLEIGVLIIGDSTYNRISDSTFTNNRCGVVLGSYDFYYENYNNNISNNIFIDNVCGVSFVNTIENRIYKNIFDGNIEGISITPRIIPIGGTQVKSGYRFLGNYYSCYIINNYITNNRWGISLSFSGGTKIYKNNITQNKCGIADSGLYGCGGNNEIHFNNIMNNNVGINIALMPGAVGVNDIFQNNFINNRRNANIDCKNHWDANYWDNWIGFKIKLPIFQSFPKILIGFDFVSFILRLNFDWNPASEPYDIPGSSSFVGCGIK